MHTHGLTRRSALRALGGACSLGLISGCARGTDASVGEVVLYSSVDDFVVREAVEAFRAETGVDVRLQGDTEATKTTALVERLVAERDEPRADVWWSSEPFGTIRLAGMGLFEPSGVSVPPVSVPGLAGRLDAPDGLWHGFALRARVLCVRQGVYTEASTPRRLGELTDPRFAGRVGIARPRFGTTRGHMGALLVSSGEGAFRAWLSSMVDNGLKVYGSNSQVVRATSEGEIDVCLTDTDDVWVAQANGRPVDVVFEAPGDGAVFASPGPMLIPNTVARVRGGPNADGASRLIEYLLGGEAERLLAYSDSHNLPVRREPFPDLRAFDVPDGWLPDLGTVAAVDDSAMAICDELLG